MRGKLGKLQTTGQSQANTTMSRDKRFYNHEAHVTNNDLALFLLLAWIGDPGLGKKISLVRPCPVSHHPLCKLHCQSGLRLFNYPMAVHQRTGPNASSSESSGRLPISSISGLLRHHWSAESPCPRSTCGSQLAKRQSTAPRPLGNPRKSSHTNSQSSQSQDFWKLSCTLRWENHRKPQRRKNHSRLRLSFCLCVCTVTMPCYLSHVFP